MSDAESWARIIAPAIVLAATGLLWLVVDGIATIGVSLVAL